MLKDGVSLISGTCQGYSLIAPKQGTLQLWPRRVRGEGDHEENSWKGCKILEGNGKGDHHSEEA